MAMDNHDHDHDGLLAIQAEQSRFLDRLERRQEEAEQRAAMAMAKAASLETRLEAQERAIIEYRSDVGKVFKKLDRISEQQAVLNAHATTGRLVISGAWLLVSTIIGGAIVAIANWILGK